MPRNFQVFDPVDFLAEVTQHIPNLTDTAFDVPPVSFFIVLRIRKNYFDVNGV